MSQMRIQYVRPLIKGHENDARAARIAIRAVPVVCLTNHPIIRGFRERGMMGDDPDSPLVVL